MIAALWLFALAAGLSCGVVLAVYRSGDVERVARECAHNAVSQEREQVHRVLIANATALRRAGRKHHAQTLNQVLALLKARPLQLEIDVRAFTRRRRPGQLVQLAKEQRAAVAS